jgi:AcrR family transcriptional regulator
MTVHDIDERPLRADARRNRAQILAAAEEVFAASGLAVPIDEVAARAGVGVGTVYRHFPNKEALFEAIVLHRMEGLVADARELADAPDASRAFFAFLEKFAAQIATKRDLGDALSRAGIDIKVRAEVLLPELQSAVGHLVVRAQHAGAIRRDVTAEEVFALVAGTCMAAENSGLGPAGFRRLLSVVCEGLRTSDVPVPG